MSAFDVLGFLGMGLLLGAFLLNQLNIFSNDSYAYQVFNFVGAYLLSYYAYVLGNTPFLILEFVWGSFALYQFLVFLRRESSGINASSDLGPDGK
jgi:hypothetical protein